MSTQSSDEHPADRYNNYAQKLINMSEDELAEEKIRLKTKLGMNQSEMPPWLWRQISDNAFYFEESLETLEEKMWAQAHFTIGAKSLVAQLVEAQERIRELEDVLQRLIDSPQPYNESEMWSWIHTARNIANEALSPNNKQ